MNTRVGTGASHVPFHWSSSSAVHQLCSVRQAVDFCTCSLKAQMSHLEFSTVAVVDEHCANKVAFMSNRRLWQPPWVSSVSIHLTPGNRACFLSARTPRSAKGVALWQLRGCVRKGDVPVFIVCFESTGHVWGEGGHFRGFFVRHAPPIAVGLWCV